MFIPVKRYRGFFHVNVEATESSSFGMEAFENVNVIAWRHLVRSSDSISYCTWPASIGSQTLVLDSLCWVYIMYPLCEQYAIVRMVIKPTCLPQFRAVPLSKSKWAWHVVLRRALRKGTRIDAWAWLEKNYNCCFTWVVYDRQSNYVWLRSTDLQDLVCRSYTTVGARVALACPFPSWNKPRLPDLDTS